MAWFLPSGYKFCEFYECRGTRLIGSRLKVKVHKVLLRLLVRSGYINIRVTIYKAENRKKCDKQMYFIVRVRRSRFLSGIKNLNLLILLFLFS